MADGLTNEERREIRLLVAQGLMPLAIARKMGRDEPTVKRMLHALDIPISGVQRKRKPFTKQVDAHILRLQSEGKSLTFMAAATGYEAGDIQGRLATLNARAMRARQEEEAKNSREPSLMRTAEYDLRQAGYTEARLRVMSLDQKMHAANGIRFGKAQAEPWNAHLYPQLGRKPEWLHS